MLLLSGSVRYLRKKKNKIKGFVEIEVGEMGEVVWCGFLLLYLS